MKKRIVALFLGGVMAASSLAMQVPATAWAVKFESCEDSTSHIKSSQVSSADGKLTVTIDIDFETENGQFLLYVFDKQLEKTGPEGMKFYDTQGESSVTELKGLKEGGTYTFDGLANDKTYYVYCNVEDNHEIDGWGENGDQNDTFQHYAAYLGSAALTAGSDNSGSGDTPSDKESADITTEECGYRSEPHIKSSTITTGDGQFTVAVDLIYENKYSSGINIYMLDRKLDENKLGEIDPESGYNNFYAELKNELQNDGHEAWLVDDESRKKWILLGGSCTFTGLADGRVCHIYGEVADWHDYEAEEALHSVVYLGSVTIGSNTSTEEPDNSSSNSSSSDNSASVTVQRNYTREAEERMLSQIKAAPADSTVAIEKGVTTLSNAVMKELKERGDVAVTLDFIYLGQKYVITIPAGAALDNDIPWYGPLYLAQQYGNSAQNAANEVYVSGTEKDLISQIKTAPAASTIVMENGITTLSNAVVRELSARGDVTLRLKFTYDNKEYVITIPAGAAFDDDVLWYGPLYLIQYFGSGAETAN